MSTVYDFFSPGVAIDPFPLFAQLREHDPVYETSFGYWYVSRYDDTNTLLRDPRMEPGSGTPDALGVTGGPLRQIMDTWMMALHGPEHGRVRRLVSRSLTTGAVAALRPAIERTCRRLIGAMAANGGGDIVADLAFPLPMEIVRLLFGVEAGEWNDEVAALFDPHRNDAETDFVEQTKRLVEYFWRLVPARRAQPGSDLFSAMVRPDSDGNQLSDLELVANAVLLATAGFETTMGLLSLAVLTLLIHPDQLARLRAQPDLGPSAVEEVLRYEPAALSTTRHTPVELEVAGTIIPAGSNLLFSIVAANRDPRRFADPDRFDIARRDNRPLTFGGGAHLCIGASLARTEAQIMLATLLPQAPELRLVDHDVDWLAGNPTIRRPVTLPVRF
jgi:cytochrome P450